MAPPEVVSTRPCPPVPAFKERPILFSAPMVRALLDGSKTQTRRVVKPQPWATARSAHFTPATADGEHPASVSFSAVATYDPPWACMKPLRSPYGQPGDRLWVRENGWERPELSPRDLREGADTWPPYEFDAEPLMCWAEGELKGYGWRRRPSIHMPRWASRIDLEVTDVRVERLQDISEADALAEGITSVRSPEWDALHWSAWRLAFDEAVTNGTKPPIGPLPSAVYRAIWEDINGANSWAANPWVWIVEFRRIRP